jgi:hypothetical protein
LSPDLRAIFKKNANEGGSCQSKSDLKSPADLNIPPSSPNIVIQAFHFVGEFSDRFEQAFVDVSLRDLLPCIAKKSFGA